METIGHDAKGLGEAFDGKPSRGVIHPFKKGGMRSWEEAARWSCARDDCCSGSGHRGIPDLRSEGCSKQADNPIFWNIATNNE